MRALPLALLAAVATVATQAPVGTPPRAWEADVSVRALELTAVEGGEGHRGPITVRVVVATDGDGARAVRLEVMLPVGVGVVRVPRECRASPAPVMSLSARVTCTLGDLPARASRALSITTTGTPPSRGRPRFAAFVVSDTPDPAPANNFAERVLP